MIAVDTPVKIIKGLTPSTIPAEVLASEVPLLLKGLVADWPLVKAGLQSAQAVSEYLLQFYRGQEVPAFLGKPEMGGRIFYDQQLTGFNYDTVNTKLDFALKQLNLQASNAQPPSIYIGSTSVDDYLPGLRGQNDLHWPFACDQGAQPLASIWLSNRCRIAAHWDSPLNIACCVAGRRRFTLFPFEQLDNLYVGPLDKTPAGQPISLVDFYQPDFARFPKFREALKHAQVAELEPGDALFIPSMWWHHVESLESLNILLNYWFMDVPVHYGKAVNALYHAVLAIRELSAPQRRAWQQMFDHFVFAQAPDALAHIPESARGLLGELSEDNARRIRARLLNQLNR